jgi:hypothetical protein
MRKIGQSYRLVDSKIPESILQPLHRYCKVPVDVLWMSRHTNRQVKTDILVERCRLP